MGTGGRAALSVQQDHVIGISATGRARACSGGEGDIPKIASDVFPLPHLQAWMTCPSGPPGRSHIGPHLQPRACCARPCALTPSPAPRSCCWRSSSCFWLPRSFHSGQSGYVPHRLCLSFALPPLLTPLTQLLSVHPVLDHPCCRHCHPTGLCTGRAARLHHPHGRTVRGCLLVVGLPAAPLGSLHVCGGTCQLGAGQPGYQCPHSHSSGERDMWVQSYLAVIAGYLVSLFISCWTHSTDQSSE